MARAEPRPTDPTGEPAAATDVASPPEVPPVATLAAPPEEHRRPGRYEALRLRDFRLLLAGTVASGFGQWGMLIGLNWLAYQESNESALMLSIVAGVGGAARLFSGPLSGVALDRFHRRMVLVWSTWVSAAKGVVLAAVVIGGAISMPLIFLFAIVEGVVSTTNQNARQAFVYDVTTPQTLANGVALNAIALNLARIVGPTLVGAMIGLLGLASPFLFITVMMSISAILTVMISQTTRQAARDREHPLRSLWLGMQYASQDRAVLGLILIAAIPALFIYPYVQLMPVFAEEVLDRGAEGYGMLAGAIGWGSLIGLIGLSLVGDIRFKGALMLWCFVAYTAVLIGFTQSTVFVLSLALLTVAGVFHGLGLTLAQTLVQLLARDDMRGRTTSLFQMGFGLMPLGALPMGIAIEAFGPQSAVAAFMAVALVFFVIQALTWRSLLSSRV